MTWIKSVYFNRQLKVNVSDVLTASAPQNKTFTGDCIVDDGNPPGIFQSVVMKRAKASNTSGA